MTIKRIIISIALVFFGWIATLAGVMLISDDAPSALVLFPSENLHSQLDQDVAFIDIGANYLVLKGATTSTLYAAGAKLVLPAGLSGCLALLS